MSCPFSCLLLCSFALTWKHHRTQYRAARRAAGSARCHCPILCPRRRHESALGRTRKGSIEPLSATSTFVSPSSTQTLHHSSRRVVREGRKRIYRRPTPQLRKDHRWWREYKQQWYDFKSGFSCVRRPCGERSRKSEQHCDIPAVRVQLIVRSSSLFTFLGLSYLSPHPLKNRVRAKVSTSSSRNSKLPEKFITSGRYGQNGGQGGK